MNKNYLICGAVLGGMYGQPSPVAARRPAVT